MERELHQSVVGKVRNILSPFRGKTEKHEYTLQKETELQVDFRYGIIPSDIEPILEWAQDPETQGHLDPLPYLPDWKNPKDVFKAKDELQQYYANAGDDIHKIQPVVAHDENGNALGVLTIRWRGDKYVPKDNRIASIERLIVAPEYRKKKVATKLLTNAIDYAFNSYQGYQGKQGAKEIRAWIMTDDKAGNYSKNYSLFRKLGFKAVQGEQAHWKSPRWSEFKKSRDMEDDEDRDALWLTLKRADWMRNNENKNMQNNSVL